MRRVGNIRRSERINSPTCVQSGNGVTGTNRRRCIFLLSFISHAIQKDGFWSGITGWLLNKTPSRHPCPPAPCAMSSLPRYVLSWCRPCARHERTRHKCLSDNSIWTIRRFPYISVAESRFSQHDGGALQGSGKSVRRKGAGASVCGTDAESEPGGVGSGVQVDVCSRGFHGPDVLAGKSGMIRRSQAVVYVILWRGTDRVLNHLPSGAGRTRA
jgi:hypothetical protein